MQMQPDSRPVTNSGPSMVKPSQFTATAPPAYPSTETHVSALSLQPASTVQAQRAARWALYGSHALSTWGGRAWEFLIGLLMLQLWPQSFLLVSAFGLLDSGVGVVFGSSVGTYLDRYGLQRTSRGMRRHARVCNIQRESGNVNAFTMSDLVLHLGSTQLQCI